MPEFTELEPSKDIADMEADEARETLTEFMDYHEQNEEAYSELEADLEETETEYQEKLDEAQERMAQFREARAEEAEEYVNMPADLIADRFSLDEIETIIEEAEGSADFSEEEDEDDDDTERLTTFSEQQEKGEQGGDGSRKHRERAEQVLSARNFPTGD
jgi:hypothetical protein